VKNDDIRILRDIEQYYSTQIDEMPMNGKKHFASTRDTFLGVTTIASEKYTYSQADSIKLLVSDIRLSKGRVIKTDPNVHRLSHFTIGYSYTA